MHIFTQLYALCEIFFKQFTRWLTDWVRECRFVAAVNISLFIMFALLCWEVNVTYFFNAPLMHARLLQA